MSFHLPKQLLGSILTSMLAVAFTFSNAFAQDATYNAQLSGRNEVLPVVSSASGQVTATLTGNELVVTGSFSGLSSAVDTSIVGGAHLHIGYAGQNGPVAIPLSLSFEENMQSGTFEAAENTYTLTEEQLAALTERRMYVNIHTMNFPGGELRGQVLADAEEYFSANLFSSNEVPAAMSGASGALVLELNGNDLTVSGAFADLESDFATNIAGGAHLHIGMAGMNGPVSIPIMATPSDDMRSAVFESANNTYTLDEEQRAALLGRRMYVNIHSENIPSGEIRGQVVPAATRTLFRTHLAGYNENPAITTQAFGTVLVEAYGDSIVTTGSFSNLEGALATNIAGGVHIHTGMAGVNGPVIIPLNTNMIDANNGTFMAAANGYGLTAEQVTNLYNRGLYVNIHSEVAPSGEIRGQILPESQIAFTGYLTGIFEVPGVNSSAQGAVKAELTGNTLIVSGTFDGLSSDLATDIAGGAHIHLGYAGSNGPVEFVLTSVLDEDSQGGRFPAMSNRFELSDEQVANLRGRQNYVNIHSLNNPSGEIRGQLLPDANAFLVASLSGVSEATPVNTPATGQLIVELRGSSATVAGSFNDLQSDLNTAIAGGAHLHTGLAGQNGPVRVIINPTTGANNTSAVFTPANNTFEVTQGLVDTMRMRMHYANIHSLDNPGGEIRGQVLPLATSYFTTTLRAIHEVPSQLSDASGAMKFELSGDQLTLSGSFSDLMGDFDASIAGGSHIHLGMLTANGPIQYSLESDVAEDLKSGTYAAAGNTYTLDSVQLEALRAGNLYINIHTSIFPGGELRGQILPEQNFFPSDPPTFISPENGTFFEVDGAANEELTAEWTAASDENEIAYIWQASVNADFSTIDFQAIAGTDTTFTFTLGEVDSVLNLLGIEQGGLLQGFYRILASDGNVQTVGPTNIITIERGEVTADTGADLELMASVENDTIQIFQNQTITFTLTNDGPETAEDIIVDIPTPATTSYVQANAMGGAFNLFFQQWEIDALEAGETATLEYTIFPLQNESPVAIIAEVTASSADDPDSTPDNNVDGSPNEDDEVALNLAPIFRPMGGTTADLELAVTVDRDELNIYENYTYTLVLTNNGPDSVANVTVSTPLPQGMVYTSSAVSTGRYKLVIGEWDVPFLRSGESATLDLTLFTLTEGAPITFFAQVIASDQDDPDSTPGNNNDTTPAEDDEVAATIMPMPGNSLQATSGTVTAKINRLYPVPATEQVTLRLQANAAIDTEIRIFDVHGKVVHARALQLVEGQNQFNFNVSDLPTGMYFLKVANVETRSEWKFVKSE